MCIEKWKQSKICPDYEVNEHGTVRHRETGKIINQVDRPNGPHVGLWANTYFKYYKLSDIVADAFYDENHIGMKAIYKNKNVQDNRPENIEWKVGNTWQSFRDTEVRCIETGKDYYNIYSCSEELDVKVTDIVRSINDKCSVQSRNRAWYSFERIN